MADKELGSKQKTSKCTCPSPTMLIVYSSIVVVLVAILVPFEYNFGLIRVLRDLDKKILFQGESLFSRTLKNLGIGNFNDKQTRNANIFSKEELKKYSGDSNILYLAILGKVYDVTSGKQHYGKDGGYHFFTGKDASRAFVTGEFNEEGLVDNIENLPPKDYISLFNWMKFYEKDYKYIGKVHGYFYNKDGSPTKGLKLFEKGYQEGMEVTAKEEDDRKMFPECNSQWTKDTGTAVWCSQNSGGVQRDWIGFPRQYFKVGESNYRCACVEAKYLRDPRFKEYEKCPTDSTRCKL